MSPVKALAHLGNASKILHKLLEPFKKLINKHRVGKIGLWSTRDKTLKLIGRKYSTESRIIAEAFGLIDEQIQLFSRELPRNANAGAYGLTIAKAKNLALGTYSLLLDGFAQEAGALLRPWIECIERLKYFRLYPDEMSRAMNGEKIPPAGEIAKKIEGRFGDLRQVLNDTASHISFRNESIQHLIDIRQWSIRYIQDCDPETIPQNLASVFSFAIQVLMESRECLLSESIEIPTVLDERIWKCYEQGLLRFKPLLEMNESIAR